MKQKFRGFVEEMIGEFLYFIGIPINCSTGIHEGFTAGYGKLSSLGFWQYPSYIAARKIQKAWEARHDKEK